MPLREVYQRQVALLLRVLPHVAVEDCFALKGGTAINLFVRDMPRLSVDIDLTYLPVTSRAESLAAIDAAMRRIANRIRAAMRDAQVVPSTVQPENHFTKLLIRHETAQVKIEVTPVLRGCVFAPTNQAVSPAVETTFGFAEIQVVSFADLYAGKIVAALDRQHPRDFFDVRDLLANEGISDDLRRAFLVYLISHNRPMAEVLAPQRKPLATEFLRGFDGMTRLPVCIEELESTREELITAIVGAMPESHRQFLLTFKRGNPDWDVLGVPGASELPAVQWRRHNLDRLSSENRERLVEKLEEVLFVARARATS